MNRHIDPRTLAALTGDHGAIPSRVVHGPAIHLSADAFDEPGVCARILAATAAEPARLIVFLAVVLWAIFI